MPTPFPSMLKTYLDALGNETGEDMAEQGLLLALIAVTLIVAFITLGPLLHSMYGG
jgi:Flp pilus assembly pilin Flp